MPKVSDLDELTAGNVALADEVYIVDGGAASKRASVQTFLGTAALLTSFTVGGVKLVDNSGIDATHILAVKNTSDAAKGIVASSFIDAASNVLMNSDGLSIASDARLRFSSTTAASGTPVSTAYASSASTGSTTVSVYAKTKSDNTTVSHAFQFLGFLNGSDYEGLQVLKNGTSGWTLGIIGGGAYVDGVDPALDSRASTIKITTFDNRTGTLAAGSRYPILDLSDFGRGDKVVTAESPPGTKPWISGLKIGGDSTALTAWGDGPDVFIHMYDKDGADLYIPAFSTKPTT